MYKHTTPPHETREEIKTRRDYEARRIFCNRINATCQHDSAFRSRAALERNAQLRPQKLCEVIKTGNMSVLDLRRFCISTGTDPRWLLNLKPHEAVGTW